MIRLYNYLEIANNCIVYFQNSLTIMRSQHGIFSFTKIPITKVLSMLAFLVLISKTAPQTTEEREFHGLPNMERSTGSFGQIGLNKRQNVPVSLFNTYSK